MMVDTFLPKIIQVSWLITTLNIMLMINPLLRLGKIIF